MKTLSPVQARDIIGILPAGSYAIVDVRSPDEFRFEHVKGSINLPLDTVLEHAETLRPYRHVFLYCRTGNRSGQACTRLHDATIEHAVSIEGGIGDMKHAGFTILKKKGVMPLQRQVLLGAGTIVASGIVLSYFVSPLFQLLSFAASAGLIYAGLSGNCMLALLLARMPWNKTS
jgi:rhodanese-related sulfurtransferase